MPTADLWYLRNGKVETFNCYPAISIMLAQMDAREDPVGLLTVL